MYFPPLDYPGGSRSEAGCPILLRRSGSAIITSVAFQPQEHLAVLVTIPIVHLSGL